MNDTQRLLSIALAVLALDGCRGGATHAQNGDPTPAPSTHAGSSSGYHGGHVLGGAAAGAIVGGALQRRANNAPRPNAPDGGYTRTLGGNRNAQFGHAGSHGGG